MTYLGFKCKHTFEIIDIEFVSVFKEKNYNESKEERNSNEEKCVTANNV